ncbi:MAG: right-handed parallel beta-helix repeat-containing protein [Methanosarcina sp.]
MEEKYSVYIRRNKKKIGFFLAIFLIVLDIFIIQILMQSISPQTPSKDILYVAWNGKENFSCDGKDDQVEINQALAYVAENPGLTTVYLRGPYTYTISDTIFIGNNTTLAGDPTAKIKLIDSADWPVFKPLITQIDKTGIHGVVVKGFEIDGNHDNNLDKKKGYGYYNMIHFLNCTDIQIHDMYMHDGHGEGLKTDNGNYIRFYNNTISKTGHNGVFVENSQNIEAWNNKVTVRTDSGFRSRNSNHVKIHDNAIESFYHWSAGGSGILVEKTTATVNDVEIYDNTIQDTYGPGIWLIGCFELYPEDEARNVHIYHNVFQNTGTNPNIDWVGGIVTSGFYDTLIENNTFDEVHHAAIVQMYPEGGTHIYPTYKNSGNIDLSPKGTGYTTIVRNNIIANTRQRTKDPEGTGYGVINYLPETHTVVLEYNCLYNNYAGDYLNCTSTTDVYLDPALLDRNFGAGYSSEEHPRDINQTTIDSAFEKCYS